MVSCTPFSGPTLTYRLWFAFTQVRIDRNAVDADRNRSRDHLHTRRGYIGELVCFFLCAVIVRGKPMIALLVEDCEAYKDFLALPRVRRPENGAPVGSLATVCKR